MGAVMNAVRAAVSGLCRLSWGTWEPMDWDDDSGFPSTLVLPGTPDPSSAIWAGLSPADQVRLSGLVTSAPQLRFDWGPGPYAGLVAAGLAEHVTWEGKRAFGHPAGIVSATRAGELACLASGTAHRVRLTV